MLPTDPKERKSYPIFSGVLKYFPDALAEVAKVSLTGNRQHGHTDDNLYWERGKSSDHLDAAIRHLLQSDEVDIDGVTHLGKATWRLLAQLQLMMEKAVQKS